MKKRPEDISIFDPVKTPRKWPVIGVLGAVVALNIGWALAVWDWASLGFIILAGLTVSILLSALRAHRAVDKQIADHNEDSRVRRADIIIQYRRFVELDGEDAARTMLMESLRGDVGTFRDIVGDRENS